MIKPAPADRHVAGFTLVELLVVMTILMILMLLVMVPMKGLRDRADTILCANNLRSIGIAASLYAAEHNDSFPCADNWASSDAGWYKWTTPNSLERGTLYTYLGNTRKAFLCPTFVRLYRMNPDLAHLTAHMNYVMNHFYASWGWQGYTMVKRSDTAEPTQLGLFTEENPFLTKYNNFIVNDLRIAVGNFGDPNNIVDATASYHYPPRGDLAEGYGNVCFADGHVERVHISLSKEVFTPECIKAKYPNVIRQW